MVPLPSRASPVVMDSMAAHISHDTVYQRHFFLPHQMAIGLHACLPHEFGHRLCFGEVSSFFSFGFLLFVSKF